MELIQIRFLVRLVFEVVAPRKPRFLLFFALTTQLSYFLLKRVYNLSPTGIISTRLWRGDCCIYPTGSSTVFWDSTGVTAENLF